MNLNHKVRVLQEEDDMRVHAISNLAYEKDLSYAEAEKIINNMAVMSWKNTDA